MLSPKESGNFIANQSKMVTINEKGISSLSEQIYSALKDGSLSISNLLSHNSYPPQLSPEQLVNWILVVDTLNFCFWAINNGKWKVKWHGEVHSGYFALCAAINKAIENGIDMTNPAVYSRLTIKELSDIMQSKSDRLIEKRLDFLHEVGRVLLENYNGSFVNCVVESEKSAQRLLQLIVTKFSCFRDTSEYKGEKVAFYKRAQILVADLWTTFRMKSYGEFNDIDTITMFADYRVPQVLAYFGVLEYTKELKEKLNDILENGCDEELELRGCSIEAVEQLNSSVKKLLQQRDCDQHIVCNSILIDNFLWDYRRLHAAKLDSIPYHKVISVYY